jgi:hypothetical protein
MAGQKGGGGNVDDLCAVVGLKSLSQDAKLSMGICNKINNVVVHIGFVVERKLPTKMRIIIN